MDRLFALDDDRTLDARRAGGKAAGLARAVRAGLPVLPGWVVPTDAGAAAIGTGVETLERSGRAAAVLRVCEVALGRDLERDLRRAVEDLGPRSIVRSSARQEADPRWAGAFGTYEDVAAEDIEAAVRGCWASAFSRDVLERCAAMDVRPAELSIGVLLQPWVRFDAGGTATVGTDGSVLVAGAPASPDEIVSGRVRTVVARLGPRGRLEGDDGTLDGRLLGAVADLARAARETAGGASIEWGAVGQDPRLLQVCPARHASAGTRVPWRPRRSFPEIAERLAEVAARYPAPLGEQVVLPWAVALEHESAAAMVRAADLGAAVDALRVEAAALTAVAWEAPSEAAAREAAQTFRAVLGPDPDGAFGRLSQLRAVDPASARRVLGLVEFLAHALVDRGVLGTAASVWHLSIDELYRAVRLGSRAFPERFGRDRWEPFVAEVTEANGHAMPGTPVAPGVGAGPVHVLEGPPDAWRPARRRVLAVREPLPHLAPLLWSASGLVAARGGAGAHLFEVARSLGVPAVIGVEVPPSANGALAAVDGDVGTVALLETRRSSAEVGA